MSCTNPLQAYESPFVHPSGKKKLVFNPAKSIDGKVIPLPCGQCDSCRLTKAKQWAWRCMQEASLYRDNIWLTLTYSPEEIPLDLSLDKSHFQKFIRSVRDKYRDTNENVRFYMVGEYGEASYKNDWIARPHYHAIVFNFDFPDKKLLYTNSSGERIYDSEICKELWGRGSIEIGTVTPASVAYTTRYCLKKVGRKDANAIDPDTGLKHYEIWNPNTGEKNSVLPEYTQMSTSPGIAADWFRKYKKDVYPSGQIYLGHFAAFPGDKPVKMEMKAPPYFDKLLERERPDMMEFVSEQRKQYAKDNAANFTDAALDARALSVNQRIARYAERKL